MDLDNFVYCVKGIMLLDSDGNRLIAKYYDGTFAGVQQEKEFERKVFNKTRKLNCPYPLLVFKKYRLLLFPADIILLDGLICVYKSSVDLYFCVIGSGQQDELILYSVLNCFYESVVHILKKSVEKKTLYECIDMVMLAIDEICDSGVILETDYNSVLSRLAFRSDELSFSEQTVAQVGMQLLILLSTRTVFEMASLTSKIVQMNQFTNDVMKCRSEYLRFQRSKIGVYANLFIGALSLIDIKLLRCRLSAHFLKPFIPPEFTYYLIVSVLVICLLNLATAVLQYGRILWASYDVALSPKQKAMLGIGCQGNPVAMDGGRFIRSRDQIRSEWVKRSQTMDVSHKSASLLSTTSGSAADMSSFMSRSGASWKSADSWLFIEAQKSRQELSPVTISEKGSPFLSGKRQVTSKDFAKPAITKSSTPKVEPCSLNVTLEKFALSEERLAVYAERLRLWIFVTILQPLVEEMDRINQIFVELSRPDVKVGVSPVTTLQSMLIAKSEQLSTLAPLIRYLEISTNQEYLVERLRSLAKDSAIAEYKWNAGGRFGQKPWDEHLPTDTEILFHLFCTFLDNQLPISPLCLDGRTFSAEHVAKAPNVPCTGPSTLCIYQAAVNPPHFQLIHGNEWHDVGKGKKNFLYTIILFLQALKLHRGAFLDQMTTITAEGIVARAEEMATCSRDSELNLWARQYFERKGGLPPGKRRNADDQSEEDEDEDKTDDAPPLSQIRELLSGELGGREANKMAEKAMKSLEAEFPVWMLYLSQRFNLLLYGYGSKAELLERFCKKELDGRYTHFLIKGYEPQLNLCKALRVLAENLNLLSRRRREQATTITSAARMADLIRNGIAKLKEPIDVVILIPSLDGIALRTMTNRQAIYLLSEIPEIHLIASVDHRNSAILFDDAKLSRGNFIWIEATTYKSYGTEILAGESKILGLSRKMDKCKHSLSSLECVWASLTSKGMAAFVHLARMALRSKTGDVAFWDWYRCCLDDFVVSSEASLRQHLVEFQDHRLVSTKTGTDGTDLLHLEVDRQLSLVTFELYLLAMKEKHAAGEKRKAPAQVEEGESSLRDRLEKTDPEFVEFLKSEDPSIFEEFAQVEDDIPDMSEEGSDETESEEEPQSEDEQAETSDESKSTTRNILSESLLLRTDEDIQNGKENLGKVKLLVDAFAACVSKAGAKMDKFNVRYEIKEIQTMNTTLRLCFGHFPSLWQRIAGTEAAPGKNALKRGIWCRLFPTVKVYLRLVVKLLAELSNDDMLKATLEHLTNLTQYYGLLPRTSKMLLRRLISIWSTRSLECRKLAHSSIMRVVQPFSDVMTAMIFRGMYLAYVRNSKIIEPSCQENVRFMQDTFAEVCRLNPRLTYRHAFLFIRQLAISLRNATISKTENSAKLVQSWQFVQSVLLWCRVLANCSDEAVLQPIRYPLIHVAFGCARLNQSQKIIPLIFHICQGLLELSEQAQMFIPVQTLLLETLCLVNFNHRPKRSTLKPINFDCCLKLSNAHLLESSFRLITMDRVVEYMQRFFYINRRSVSFPELAFPVVEALKAVYKKCRVSNFSLPLKQLVDVLSKHSVWVAQQRRKGTTANALATDVMMEFDGTLPECSGSPLESFYVKYSRVKAREAAVRQYATGDSDDVSRKNDSCLMRNIFDMSHLTAQGCSTNNLYSLTMDNAAKGSAQALPPNFGDTNLLGKSASLSPTAMQLLNLASLEREHISPSEIVDKLKGLFATLCAFAAQQSPSKSFLMRRLLLRLVYNNSTPEVLHRELQQCINLPIHVSTLQFLKAALPYLQSEICGKPLHVAESIIFSYALPSQVGIQGNLNLPLTVGRTRALSQPGERSNIQELEAPAVMASLTTAVRNCSTINLPVVHNKPRLHAILCRIKNLLMQGALHVEVLINQLLTASGNSTIRPDDVCAIDTLILSLMMDLRNLQSAIGTNSEGIQALAPSTNELTAKIAAQAAALPRTAITQDERIAYSNQPSTFNLDLIALGHGKPNQRSQS
ncbi:clathrin adaptor complex small chain [Trichuris suis]|nr:clathrin adaptor complex small chain [Trichuris suis]